MKFKQFIIGLPSWTLTVIVTLAILYLTLVPQPLPDNDIPWFEGMDKVVHAVMMCGFCGCLSLDYLRKNINKVRIPFKILTLYLVATILFGGLIEILQKLMDLGRGMDIMDFTADSIGALVAYIIALSGWSHLQKWFQQP